MFAHEDFVKVCPVGWIPMTQFIYIKFKNKTKDNTAGTSQHYNDTHSLRTTARDPRSHNTDCRAPRMGPGTLYSSPRSPRVPLHHRARRHSEYSSSLCQPGRSRHSRDPTLDTPGGTAESTCPGRWTEKVDRILSGVSRNSPAGLMYREEGRKLWFYAQSAITVI